MTDKIPILADSTGTSRGTKTRRDYFRIALNLSGSILQVATGYLPQVGVGRRIGATPYVVKAQPAGIAFAIWGVIFPLCICYGIFQALPGQHTSPLLRTIGIYSLVAFYATILWSLIAILAAPADDDTQGYVVYEWILSVTLLFFIATPLNYTMLALLRCYDNDNSSSGGGGGGVLSQKEYLFVVLPLSVFASWTTLAAFVNIAGALLVSGVSNFNVTNSAEGGTVAYLCCVGTLIAVLLFAYRGLLPYAFVDIWAFAWIAQVNFASDFDQVGVVATVLAALFAVVAVGSKWWWWARSSHSLPVISI